MNRYYNFIERLEETEFNKNGFKNEDIDEALGSLMKRFEKAMNDDFNVPKAIGEIFSTIRVFNQYLDELDRKCLEAYKVYKEKFLDDINKISDILGVFGTSSVTWFIPEDLDVEWVKRKIEERTLARKNKDYETADRIRKELADRGIILEDARNYTRWKVKR